MLKLGSGGCLDGPDFSPASSPQSSAFLPGPSTAPRWYAEPHLISVETVLQPLEMPTPISFAKFGLIIGPTSSQRKLVALE